MERSQSNDSDSRQYNLVFDAAQNELLAIIRTLRWYDSGLSRGRTEGVIQLLERLTLLGSDVREDCNGCVHVKAQTTGIAARVNSRRSVSERTVRNWRRDAERLGVLQTSMRSQVYGGHDWNVYTICVSEIRKLAQSDSPESRAETGGNGRKRAETISAPRAETISAPRAETISALYHSDTQSDSTKYSPPLAARRASRRTEPQTLTVPAAWLVVVSALKCLGMGDAEGAVLAARRRELSIDDVHELMALWERQRARQTSVTVGWLHRWLTGKSTPPSEREEVSMPSARSPTESQLRSEWEQIEMRIRRAGFKAQADESEIERRVSKARDAFDRKLALCSSS